jgi:hypothetical protein
VASTGAGSVPQRAAGLAPAWHERHVEPAPVGFGYRLVVSYTPRRGGLGLLDRALVRWAIRRALVQTVAALDRRFVEPRTPA